MKTIGMLGGMSWESSRLYYEIMNRDVQKRLGGVHSAKVLLWSVDFGEISEFQRHRAMGPCHQTDGRDRRRGSHTPARIFSSSPATPCTCMADDGGARGGHPPAAHRRSAWQRHQGRWFEQGRPARLVLHDGRRPHREGPPRRALRASRPSCRTSADAADVDRIILSELVRAELRDASRARYREIIAKMVARGAQGIVLGCTEIPLLLRAEDSPCRCTTPRRCTRSRRSRWRLPEVS